MVIDIKFFLEPEIIFLAVLAISLIIFIAILFIINKRLKKKVMSREAEHQKESSIAAQIQILKISREPLKTKLNEINKLARYFFQDAYSISIDKDYSEIKDILRKKEKNKAADFSDQMLKVLYSGEKITNEKISILLKSLDSLVKEENPQIKEVKKEQIKLLIKEEQIPKQESGKPLAENLPVKEDEKSQTVNISEADKIAHELTKIDEEQVRDAYKEIQKRFKQAYKIAEKLNNKNNMKELEEFRKNITRAVNDYVKDRLNILELAHEISNGAKILRSMGSF